MERLKTIPVGVVSVLLGTAIALFAVLGPFLLLVAVNIGLTLIATSPLVGTLFFAALIGVVAGSVHLAFRSPTAAAK